MNGRIPTYRKHSSRDKAIVEHNGKRRTLPGKFNSAESKQAYENFLCSIGVDGNLNAADGTPLSVGRLVAMFLEWAAGEYGEGPDTRYSVYRAATKHLFPEYRHHDADKFGPKCLRSVMDKMAKKKLSRNYINAVRGQICFVFQWGVVEELIPPAVLHAIERVPGLRKGRTEARETDKKIDVKWEWVESILPEVSPTVQNMLRFQWLVFFRSKSICLAEPEQFKTDDTVWEWRPRHKTEHLGNEAVLFVGPKAQSLLKPLLEETKPGKRLFPGYTTRSYCRAVTRAIARVNKKLAEKNQEPIPRWSPHCLRHTRGDYVRQRFGAEAAQAALAHESLKATELYTKRLQDKARSVASEIG